MARLTSMTSRSATSDDETLLTRIAAGDDMALSALYERHAGTVYSLARRMLDTPELAEDIVQETFWRVWRQSATFQAAHQSVEAKLIDVAHQLARDELRRQNMHSALSNGVDGRHPWRGTADATREPLIQGPLAHLPREQRDVIELAYFGGLSQRQIAERLQTSISTIKARVYLGLQTLCESWMDERLMLEESDE